MPDYSELNEAQQEAVTWEGGPLLVLAGPGSGKTFTIVKRISYLLDSGAVPEEILVITFTREAAASMQRRFQEISEGFRPVNFGTFHSVFYHILKESHCINYPRILMMNEKINILTPILKRCQRDRSQGNTMCFDNLREDAITILSAIGYYKNTLCAEAALAGIPARWQENFRHIYREYESAVTKCGSMDFDDILFLCRKLLKENAAVRKIWQKRFRYILIDEFQDINPVQYEILKLLSAPPYHIFAVGDDDQSIYGFRGSKPECLKKFEVEFHARRICLDVNYRSGQKIIDSALAVMEESRNRYEKQLKSGCLSPGEGTVTVKNFIGKEQEQIYLMERLQTGEHAEENIAVLFRTNSAMQNFAAFLHRNKIPYQMKERNRSIYEHFIVKDIMAYLLLAEDEENREYFLRIMNRPCRFISREMTWADEASSRGLRQLRRQLECIRRFSLPMAITYILRGAGYERYLRQLAVGMPDKWQEWQEILEWLKREAADYQTAADWQEMQWLYHEKMEQDWKSNEKENQNKVLKTEGTREKSAVQLMTVHAAKGLEFDTVLIPDCNEGMFPYSRMADKENVEEERRILYVAMTRAKRNLELLYLTGTEKSPRPPSRFLNPLLYSSSSTSSSNSQLSRYSSKASDTFSYSSSSSM